MLRAYEALILLDPTLDTEQIEQTMRRFLETVQKNGGVIDNLEPLGRRRLAYEIGGHREGVYVLMTFRSGPVAPNELRRALRLSDSVLRSMVVRAVETNAAKSQDAREGEASAAPEPAEVPAAAVEAE
ncbi:MAG: 30S ribosomal protein S6 [Clostridia bacterium]|nr:30S ribosomal protein S6 [Clostridia bacterium]